MRIIKHLVSTSYHFLKKAVPIVNWIVNYEKANIVGDIIGGLTTGSMLLPQGMSYAVVAGLPPVYGLYCFISMMVFACFGTSKHLSVGPVALVSLLLSNAFSHNMSEEQKVTVAIGVTFVAGFILLGFGLFQLGFLIHFVSHPVISGFTSAAAMTIALTQISTLLGFKVNSNDFAWKLFYETIANISQTNIATMLMSFSCLVILFSLRLLPIHRWLHLPQIVPVSFIGSLGPLLVLILFTGLNYAWKLSDHFHITQVGEIPSGIPVPSIPKFSGFSMSSYIGSTFAVALLVIAESMSIALALGSRYGYEIDASQELRALGISNIIGSIFHSYAVAGSFSRSAVNAQVGATTQLAGILASLIILLALLVLMPLFAYLPTCILSCIVVVAVINLIDYREVAYLWRIDRLDFIVLILAFILTLGAGAIYGLASAIGISFIIMIYATYKPKIQVIERLPENKNGESICFSSHRNKLILQVHENLYFGNIKSFESKLLQLVEKEKHQQNIDMLLVDIAGITMLDSSALAIIRDIREKLRWQQIEMLFCHVPQSIHHKFCLAGLAGNSYLHGTWDALVDMERTGDSSLTEQEISTSLVQVSTHWINMEQQSNQLNCFGPLHFLYHDDNKYIDMQKKMKRSTSTSW
eukprot:jgi/Galph1/28/GphlegSOOS_G4864.1